jgi:hypothetical protein
VFFRDKKMQILAEVDDHMGTSVDLVAMLGLLVSTLNTIVSKESETEKSYLVCGPSFSKEHKSLETLPMEELETILQASLYLERIHQWTPPEGKGSTCSCSARYRQFSGFKWLDQQF